MGYVHLHELQVKILKQASDVTKYNKLKQMYDMYVNWQMYVLRMWPSWFHLDISKSLTSLSLDFYQKIKTKLWWILSL